MKSPDSKWLFFIQGRLKKKKNREMQKKSIQEVFSLSLSL